MTTRASIPGTHVPSDGYGKRTRAQQEWDERQPPWWDADGWVAYRTRMGLPQIPTEDD